MRGTAAVFVVYLVFIVFGLAAIIAAGVLHR